MWFNKFNVCITVDVAWFTTKKADYFCFLGGETKFHWAQPMIPEQENSHWGRSDSYYLQIDASKMDKTLNWYEKTGHFIYLHQKQNGA